VDANDEDTGNPGSEHESEITRKDREWAAKAATPAQDQAGTHGPAAGYGQSSSSQTYRTPKNLRTSAGPRFSGRGVLAVFGILGMLLTIAIMAFLAVKVLDGVSGQGDGGNDNAAQIDPSGSTDAARAAECEAERAMIETAAAAFELLHGRPPSSVDEIVAEGYLRPDDGGFSHELSADGAVVGTGDCAPG
jgi:hypothetical protein